MKQILKTLPPRLREGFSVLAPADWDQMEEIRLRPHAPVLLCSARGERELGEQVLPGELELTLELAARASIHAVLPQLRRGYLTLQGGHRLGVCGSAVLREGEIQAISPLSSLNLRLARQVKGAGEGLMGQLCPEGEFRSALILAPPGAGKTTLLRDIVRCLSDGIGCAPHRVGLADERGEVAALYQGEPQLEVGRRTDVMEGCSKADALMLLLRGMNPRVLCADEITEGADVRAMERSAGCGVALLCTAHGRDRADLNRRKLYREMMESGIFHTLVTIRGEKGVRRYEVEELT